jgi:dTMP kinase
MSRGLLVTFEGPDGSGKTTQVELLGRALEERGIDPLVVREPGGTEVGERIRSLLLDGPAMSPDAEMYLFMAARAELLATRILPALLERRVVIADRYHDSTLAYQGGGRGATATWPPGFPKPDLTVLLAIPAGAGLDRLRASGKRLDRLDSESNDFHEAVAATYEVLAAAEPDRWLRIDATRSADAVNAEIAERVWRLLESREEARA